MNIKVELLLKIAWVQILSSVPNATPNNSERYSNGFKFRKKKTFLVIASHICTSWKPHQSHLTKERYFMNATDLIAVCALCHIDPKSFFFCFPNFLFSNSQLMVLIHSLGLLRVGQWHSGLLFCIQTIGGSCPTAPGALNLLLLLVSAWSIFMLFFKFAK